MFRSYVKSRARHKWKLWNASCVSKQFYSFAPLMQKYERFNWFLEHCNCTKTELSLIWSHIDAFESNSRNYNHVAPWFYAQENMQRIRAPNKSQNGCFDIIPHLKAQPIWELTQFDAVLNDIFCETNFIDIQHELLSFIKQSEASHGFQPYKNANDRGANDKGHWNVLYFFLHDLMYQENIKQFPKTINVINAIKQSKCTLFPHALISCLSPDGHIMAHNGPTNKKLRVYLPLLMEENTNVLKVEDEIVYLKEGKCIIFDDSFVHQASNHSLYKSRFTLIFDLWHPDLTAPEIEFLSVIQKVFERNLLESARNNTNLPNEHNPYIAMLNAQQSEVPLEQTLCGWR